MEPIADWHLPNGTHLRLFWKQNTAMPPKSDISTVYKYKRGFRTTHIHPPSSDTLPEAVIMNRVYY